MKKIANNTDNKKRKRQFTKEEKRQALKSIKGCFSNITFEEYEKNKMEAILR